MDAIFLDGAFIAKPRRETWAHRSADAAKRERPGLALGLAPHVVLMYAAFATLAVAAGAPKYPVALSLAYASSLCTALTNYSASPATIFFGAGYVDQTTWWKFGFLVSMINLVI
jgi:di/tricarboxylate transporter